MEDSTEKKTPHPPHPQRPYLQRNVPGPSWDESPSAVARVVARVGRGGGDGRDGGRHLLHRAHQAHSTAIDL